MPEQRSASYSLFSTCLWSFVSFFSSSSAVSGSRVLGGSPTDLLTWNIFRETHLILVLPKHCFMTPNSGGLLHKPKHFFEKVTGLYLQTCGEFLLLVTGGSLERWLWGWGCCEEKRIALLFFFPDKFFKKNLSGKKNSQTNSQTNFFFLKKFVLNKLYFFGHTYVILASPWFWLLVLHSLQMGQCLYILSLHYSLLPKRDKTFLKLKKHV